ncbi:unnamed protein product [Mycena citricolor]|uniref:DUF300-domain-containing protein n=1 Tax=Mycena citricolor TaxID=2018698 RepID=A0AAD2HXZ9_9AGAR|nr:unnamed protein product [Mycena citricolor]
MTLRELTQNVRVGRCWVALPTAVLTVAGMCTMVAVLVSGMSIHMQLRNYRKPALQRMVVRIMVMVPLYGIASLISLFSLQAAFFIDAIRDVYEAFVIYCFFVLLLSYLGGERSLLIMMHGRPPKDPVFPVSLWKREIDVSDPYMFLFLKRGILQYVQIKPILAIVTMILKATGKYNEGNLRWDSGFLYISVIYNTSICLSLYCLAVFWMCTNEDLLPFRPMPKFLCVKGILFFSFWQALFISILVSAGAIKHLGPYTRDEDEDTIALALTDLLICIEMPLFAIAHAYAFSHTDFIDRDATFVARMPMLYAMRDSCGMLDVVADSKATLRGEGMDYRAFEPSEGYMHQGEGRDRRIRAGLRYADGGRRKYWLPQPAENTQVGGGGVRRIVDGLIGQRDSLDDVHAPLMAQQEERVVTLAPDLVQHDSEDNIWTSSDDGDGYSLPFGDADALGDEELFRVSRSFVFGDYNYPVIDVSSEQARTQIWDEEERVLRDERGAWFSPIRGPAGVQASIDARQHPRWNGYGAVGQTGSRPNASSPLATSSRERLVDHSEGLSQNQEGADDVNVRLRWTKTHAPSTSRTNSGAPKPAASAGSPPGSRHDSVLPPDAVDLVVEDPQSPGNSGLRNIYRQGLVREDSHGRRVEGEVEVTDMRSRPSTPTRIDIGEKVSEAVREGDDAEVVVARVQTPPAHAQLTPSGSEDNPWA